MNNVTRIQIYKPASEAFEAFVDPARIGNFWFSSSSARWEEGKTITLRYEEYDAQGDIDILTIEKDRRIVFKWSYGDDHVVTIRLEEPEPGVTIVEVTEEGFDENDANLIGSLLGNKEGWVYALTCLKAYLEFGVTRLRAGLV
ncbi:SRPBCC domain-containing protein [Cohnella zeiphila]|uniref:SRPBCC domain-containing protein n=1 Tax=Cohnella zeiphila TaxID=2761120 RepID=A0A7X0SJJ9_9BACL|nr:SRPBCC domain-containing protein [Cohnella zeiphila]MBB6731131.1 SRPBCC domain-containing protein [Cohnella zeiphila]